MVLGSVDRNAAKLLKFTPKRFHVKDRFSIGRPPNLLRVISVNVCDRGKAKIYVSLYASLYGHASLYASLG